MNAAEHDRAQGIEDLRRAGGAGRDRKDSIGWRNWVSWCGLNDQPARPETVMQERQLMLFLLHNHQEHRWKRDTCAQYAREISRAWSPEGSARTLDTETLLSWIGKQPTSCAPTSGSFDAEHVLAVGAAIQVIPSLPQAQQRSGPELALAALIALADVAGVSPLQRRGTGKRDVDEVVWGQPATSFVEEVDRITFSHDGARFLISKHRQPEHFHAVSSALARAALEPGETPPLIRIWPRLPKSSGAAQKSALLQAWVRATSPRGGRDPRRADIAKNRHAFQGWWDLSSPEDRAWLVRVAGDKGLVGRCSDIAYFYTGITTAFRHATLCEIVLDEIEVRPDGLVLNVPPTKHKSGNADLGEGKQGEWLRKGIAHHREDDGTCASYCPACALTAHVEIRRRQGATGRDRVFPPLHAGAPRLTTAAGTRALRRVWKLAETYLDRPECKAEVRIGTRSLRVTAATLARLGGLSLDAIQRLLDHRDPVVTEVYIRIHDEFADEELVLTVRPPTTDDSHGT